MPTPTQRLEGEISEIVKKISALEAEDVKRYEAAQAQYEAAVSALRSALDNEIDAVTAHSNKVKAYAGAKAKLSEDAGHLNAECSELYTALENATQAIYPKRRALAEAEATLRGIALAMADNAMKGELGKARRTEHFLRDMLCRNRSRRLELLEGAQRATSAYAAAYVERQSEMRKAVERGLIGDSLIRELAPLDGKLSQLVREEANAHKALGDWVAGDDHV